VQVNVQQAEAQLSQLVAAAERGEDVVITRDGRPVVRLVRIPAATSVRRISGGWRGRVQMGSDFDELPSDIREPFGA
jgi:prevent-host-death family protein